MQSNGATAPSGSLHLRVIRAQSGWGEPVLPVWPARGLSVREVMLFGLPSKALSDVYGPVVADEVNDWRTKNFRHLWRGAKKVFAARTLGLQHMYGQLFLTIVRADGEIVPLGLASQRVVTTTGAGFIVDAFQNLVELENMKFHGLGTGGTAEASGDTALVTELTTQYNPDNTRATGTTAEASATVYQTVGTNTVDATAAVTEHGIFSQAATGGGVLLDRTLFTVVNLASGDSLQSTYQFTVTAGG